MTYLRLLNSATVKDDIHKQTFKRICRSRRVPQYSHQSTIVAHITVYKSRKAGIKIQPKNTKKISFGSRELKT